VFPAKEENKIVQLKALNNKTQLIDL